MTVSINLSHLGQWTLLTRKRDLLLSDGVVATRVLEMEGMRRVSLKGVLRHDSQLLAASSLPVTMVSGWNKDR